MKRISKGNKNKPTNYLEKKIYKGTPQKTIDFAAYLNSSKNNSRNKYSTASKNDALKTNSGPNSAQKCNKKKITSETKQKVKVDNMLSRYENKHNDIMKRLRNPKNINKTSRVTDGVMNVKLGSHKKSNANVQNKNTPMYRETNCSFLIKKRPNKHKQIGSRK